jgi:Leucine-rich repeat (LRR) protein
MNGSSEARPNQNGIYWLQRQFEAVRGPYTASELVGMARRGELLLVDRLGTRVGNWVQAALVPQLKRAIELAELAASPVESLLRSPDLGNRLLGIAKFQGFDGRPHASLLAAFLELLADSADGDEPESACRVAVCEALVAMGGPWATIGRVHHRHVLAGRSLEIESSLRMLEERLGARGVFEIGVYLVRADRFLATFAAMERSPEAWHSAVVDAVPAIEVLRRLHDAGSNVVTLKVSLLRRAIRERADGSWRGPWPQLVRLEDDGSEQSVMLTLEGDGGPLDDGILQAVAAMVPPRIWSDIELQQLQGGLHRLPAFLVTSGAFEGRTPSLLFRECGEPTACVGGWGLSPDTKFQDVRFISCGQVHPSFIRELVPFIVDVLQFDTMAELPDLTGADPGAVGKLRKIVVYSVPVAEVPAWLRSGEGALSVSLQTLEMRHCRLQHLGGEPWSLSGLEALDLSGNCITTLGRALVKLESLSKLNVRDNRIQKIERSQWPNGAGQLDGPESSIVLAGNPLVECEVVPYAAELNLDELPLSDLPRPYGQMRFLGTLLVPLGIRFLHERLASCHRLTDVVVTGTSLEALPAWLWRLPNLRRVQASKLRNLRIEVGSHPMNPEEGGSRLLELEDTSFAPWSPATASPDEATDALGIETEDDSLDLDVEASETDDVLEIDLDLEVTSDPDTEDEEFDEAVEGDDLEEAVEDDDTGESEQDVVVATSEFDVFEDDEDDEDSEDGDWPNATFEISLAGAVLREFPEWLRDIPLTGLDICRTSIQRLPDWASGWDQLTAFRASDGALEALPIEVGRWRACERIDLCGSAVRALPGSIGGLERLTRLELRGCPIHELPQELSDCVALEMLDLDDTLVSDLPDWLCGLKALQTLKVGTPSLKTLPESIGGLLALKELHLSGSGLDKLPRSIGDLQELEELDLSNSSIRFLPSELERCGKLREIRLSGVQGVSRESLDLLSRLSRRMKVDVPAQSLIGMHLGIGSEPS